MALLLRPHRRCDMDKISSIIPANGRTRTVDVSRSQPVRPGAPTNGRPVGRSKISSGAAESEVLPPAIADKLTVSANADTKLPANPLYTKPKSESKAEMIQQMADKFFNTTARDIAKQSPAPLAEAVAENSTTEVLKEATKEVVAS